MHNSRLHFRPSWENRKRGMRYFSKFERITELTRNFSICRFPIRKSFSISFVENGGWGADLAAPLGALMIEQAMNGKLSGRSELKAEQWEDMDVIPTEYDYDYEDE